MQWRQSVHVWAMRNGGKILHVKSFSHTDLILALATPNDFALFKVDFDEGRNL